MSTTTKFFNQRVGSDVYPFEVIEKRTDNLYIVREMDFTIGDWLDGEGKDYKSVPTNAPVTIRRHKNGRFYETGTDCCPFVPSDKPYAYRDPSF